MGCLKILPLRRAAGSEVVRRGASAVVLLVSMVEHGPILNGRSRFCNTAGSKESRLAHRSTSVDDLAVVTEGGHAQRLSPPKIGSPRASRKESFGSEAPDVRDRPAVFPPGVASAAPGGHEGA